MMHNNTRLLCSFINPEAAKRVFTEGEVSDSEGFLEDLKKLDPKINLEDNEELASALE